MLLEKVNNGIYTQCRIPGNVITAKGTLLAYYECRKSNSDWADIDIKIIRSTDSGDTWNTVTIFEGYKNTLNNPVMIVNGNDVHFLFLKNYKTLFHCVSIDDGQTFSEAQEIRLDCPFFYNAVAVGPGHGIVHKDKMIVPVWFAQNKTDAKSHHPSVISTIYSTDGNEWQLGEVIGKNILQDPSECALAITQDNKVLISIRNENDCRRRAFAVSDNGIANWQNLHFHEQIPDPVCMGSMCYDGAFIYHINCNSETERTNLTIRKSCNQFDTFESMFVDSPAGYSDIAVKDDTLFILYERDCTNGGLHFKRINFKAE